MIVTGQPYDEAKAFKTTAGSLAKRLRNLQNQAQALNMKLVPAYWDPSPVIQEALRSLVFHLPNVEIGYESVRCRLGAGSRMSTTVLFAALVLLSR